MAANKTVSTINFPLSPHLSVTANIGYAHSLNIFCKTLRLTHVFPFRKTLFQKHLFCNTLFNGIFMKFHKKCTLAHSLWNNKKRVAKTGFTLVCYSFENYYISLFLKSQTKSLMINRCRMITPYFSFTAAAIFSTITQTITVITISGSVFPTGVSTCISTRYSTKPTSHTTRFLH